MKIKRHGLCLILLLLAASLFGACAAPVSPSMEPQDTPEATTLFADQSQPLASVTTPAAAQTPSPAPSVPPQSRLTIEKADVYAESLNDIPLMDFELPTLAGGTVKKSDFQGKVLVLNLMATWCPYCIDELPFFSEASTLFKDDNVAFLEISTFETGAQSSVKASLAELMEQYSLPYDMALDWDNAIGMELSPRGSIPVTLVVDTQGIVRFYYPGALQSAQVLTDLVDFTLYHLDRYTGNE